MSRKEEDHSQSESRLLRPKLIQAVAADFPHASEILLEFPDEWLLTAHLAGEPPLYIGGWTHEERVRSDHFRHLPQEVNASLTHYTLYRFFEPWPMPSLLVAWNAGTGSGRVIKPTGFNVQMQALGQAQIWHGDTDAVLWECYYYASGREDTGWEGRLAQVWQQVENDIGARVFYTLPHEPAWPAGRASYQEFLRRLGYAPASQSLIWWSKRR